MSEAIEGAQHVEDMAVGDVLSSEKPYLPDHSQSSPGKTHESTSQMFEPVEDAQHAENKTFSDTQAIERCMKVFKLTPKPQQLEVAESIH
ncbi:hypothetical protein BGW42_007050 [Actinomortierella wolfii]|nr:hypothetical protein BGW42_007050 [Actinomortierella wolfii]